MFFDNHFFLKIDHVKVLWILQSSTTDPFCSRQKVRPPPKMTAGDISYSIVRPTAFFKSLAGQVPFIVMLLGAIRVVNIPYESKPHYHSHWKNVTPPEFVGGGGGLLARINGRSCFAVSL